MVARTICTLYFVQGEIYVKYKLYSNFIRHVGATKSEVQRSRLGWPILLLSCDQQASSMQMAMEICHHFKTYLIRLISI